MPPKRMVLILDEAHILRKATSGINHTVTDLIATTICSNTGGRAYYLSGTPMLHSPQDMWEAVCALQLVSQVFGSYARFAAAYGSEVKMIRRPTLYGFEMVQQVKEWGQPGPEVARALKQVMFRKTREEVAQWLPRVSVQVRTVQPSAEASRLSDEALHAIRSRGLSVDEAFSIARLQTTARFPEVARAMAALAVSKADSLLQEVELFEAAGIPLVVGSAHRAPLEALATRTGWRSIHGGVSPAGRSRAVMEFNTGRLKGLGLSVTAGGLGIDLAQGGCDLLILDQDWSPGLNSQLADRLLGPRQTKPVSILHLVCDHPLEKRLNQVLQAKAERIDRTLCG
jgi:hypothetical protein